MVLPMLPAGHAVHAMSAEACPEDAQKPPSWQASQLVLLKSGLKRPASHAVQVSLFPRTSENEPGLHGMQLSELAEYEFGM